MRLVISDVDRQNLRIYMPDILSERLGITDLSRSFRCPSPSHDDRTPSAHYYEGDHSVHCFGCGKTWDVFSLVGELDGISGFAEQVRAVADEVGYHLDEEAASRHAQPRVRTPRPKKALFDEPRIAGGPECIEAVQKAYENLFEPGNEVARRYLRWRGLDDADSIIYGLGFTRDPKEILPQFSVYEPEALGFIVIPFFTGPSRKSANYCMVRTISRGQVKNKEWRPRGIASPLWNEWMLSAGLDVVYVTEGLIDAMALTKLLNKDVMALGGIANAKRFSQVLYRTPRRLRPSKVIVCMDEDTEGRKTRDKMCHDLGLLQIRHAVLPPYPGGAKDADEWLMNGRGEKWMHYVANDSEDNPIFLTRWF